MTINKIKTNFPEGLKRKRQEKGLSGNQIAKLLGVSQPAYNGYETGRTEPPYYILLQLADILNCTIDEFFGRNNLQQPPRVSVCGVVGDNNSNISNHMSNMTQPQGSMDCSNCLTVQSLRDVISQLINKEVK